MNKFLKTVSGAVNHWYLLTIVGVIFIALGIWVFRTPSDSYVALSWIFSISLILAGLFEIFFAISNRDILEGWGWTLSLGILNLIVGILLVMNPELSMITLPFYVGFLIMFRSIYAISFAIELKNYYVLDWGNLMAVGILGLLISFILLWNPLFAGLSLVFWTAIAFIVIGGYNIYYSIKLKQINDIPHKIGKEVRKRFNEVQKEMFEEIKKNQPEQK